MANEYLLKIMLDGLQNLATDNENLCEFMNARAAYYGFAASFEGAAHKPPGRPYPDKKVSQTKAADLVGQIADNNALAVLSLRGTPTTPGSIESQGLGEADVLRLVIDWCTLKAGVQKAILVLYGQQPAAPPMLVSPGPASEDRLWAEITSWLQKIATDTNRYVAVQKIGRAGDSKKKASGETLDPVIRIEQGVHRVALDLMQIAAQIPHHVFHAARSARTPRATRGR